jgi:hypothetical protein
LGDPTDRTPGLASTGDGAPEGYSTVQPWLVSRDTGALLDFITAVLDGVELARVATADGGIGHAEIRVGDSILLVLDAQPDWPDSRACCGSSSTTPTPCSPGRAAGPGWSRRWPTLPGATAAEAARPFGNIWWVTQRVEDVDPEEMIRRMASPLRGGIAGRPGDVGSS